MADLGTLGLALANGQGGYDAFQRGERDANQNQAATMDLKNKMMELALKDASFEDAQVKMGLDLIRSMPVRNEAMLGDRIQQAIKPLQSIERVMAPPGPDQERIQYYLDRATNPKTPVSLSVPSVGVGGRMIKDSYGSGKLPGGASSSPQQPQLSPQAAAIERLRGSSPQRSPQGYFDNPFAGQGNWQFQLGQAPAGVQVQTEDPNVITASPLVEAQSLVQPLEGGDPSQGAGYQPLPGEGGGAGVQRLEGDPQIERALNYVNRDFAMSPYSALRDPMMRRQLFDAMARTGSIPNMGIQTDATIKGLGELDQTQFLAQKQAATLNQQSSETSAKLQQRNVELEIEARQKAAALAAQMGDKEAARQLLEQVTMLKESVKVFSTQNQKPRSGSTKEDPNKVNYRQQLDKFAENVKRLEAATIKRFGVLTPENAQRLVKTNPSTYGPILEEAKRLWTLGNKWPDVRGNYAGFGGLITSGQQGAAPKASAPSGSSGAPVKGQQRKLSSGTVVTFDGTKWK